MSYAPLSFPEGRRTTARAEKLILGLDGRLKTERSIAFRRTVLPPGSYYVSVDFETVERDEKRVKEWTLSIREKPVSREAKKSTKKSSKGSPKKVPSSDADDPGLVLRVPLRFPSTKSKEIAEKLAVDLDLRSSGKQARLTVRAGSLVAVAHWRVVRVEAKKPAKRGAKKASSRTKKKASEERAKEDR